MTILVFPPACTDKSVQSISKEDNSAQKSSEKWGARPHTQKQTYVPTGTHFRESNIYEQNLGFAQRIVLTIFFSEKNGSLCALEFLIKAPVVMERNSDAVAGIPSAPQGTISEIKMPWQRRSDDTMSPYWNIALLFNNSATLRWYYLNSQV